MRLILRIMLCLVLACSLILQDAHDAQARARKRTERSAGRGVSRTVKSRAGTGPVGDARYSDIILDPQTGEVLHETNADGSRYPASLTKMMTLYLLFDALAHDKIALDDRMEVSELASEQPQTNLALSPGDRIPVETAIKALVVRSANDVAIVVAESLGGDVDHFAEMMTAKAHALGMRNTVFQNPNGLPNDAQSTSARDMAKLGIALKRDFPQYYHYFATRQFSWQGASYFTHNRVMLRYSGVDGIKTGYIGKSGFNLVTSVTRGGRPLVGVVMGGSSGRWRDDRMIALLDQAYAKLSARGAGAGKPSPYNLPLPLKTAARVAANDAPASAAAQREDAPPSQSPPSAPPAPEPSPPPAAASPAPAAPVVTIVRPQKPAAGSGPAVIHIEQPKPSSPPAPTVAKPAAASAPLAAAAAIAQPATSVPFAPASPPLFSSPAASEPVTPAPTLPPPAATARTGRAKPYGVQVGAYAKQSQAQSAITRVRKLSRTLKQATPLILPPQPGSARVYRARLQGLSEDEANEACAELMARHASCFTFKNSTP